MTSRILIVEDEADLVTLLRYNLEKAGFEVIEACNGEEALTLVEEEAPDLVVLDWMLPVMSGIEVCRRMRRESATRALPVIMLTARGEENDKIRGLNVGADDYLTKPFSLPELMARIRALLRRSKPQEERGTLSFSDVSMDLSSHKVTRGGNYVHLGPTEYRLLQFLMERPGNVFSRQELLNAVWGPDIYVEPRTVDVHIRRLRKALNVPEQPDIIRTVRAAGYALDMEQASVSA